MAAKWDLGIHGGIAIVCSIPVEDELPAGEVDRIIEQALADMDVRGIHGKDTTPFLLGRDRGDHRWSKPDRKHCVGEEQRAPGRPGRRAAYAALSRRVVARPESYR